MHGCYKVERALIMAAGKGNRLRPITDSIPKPMVEVNGKRMIDTVIDALHENGIQEIHVVVGYLKECFKPLKEKYPNLDFIDNPYYDTCNNISSLYVARDYICNAIILDGDQIVHNPEILAPDFERSGYNCTWCESDTDEWLLQIKNGVIESCSRNGGSHGWQLYSVSRWNEEDGKRLKKHLEYEFEKNHNDQIYWDDVALFCYPNEYELGIRHMQEGDISEIDTLDELMAADPSYIVTSGGKL